jgi:hypothetical protein
MLPGATKGGGTCFGMPDVCKTPSPAGPVPVPYPNTGQLNQATKTAKKVYFVGKLVVTIKSEIPQTQGDEAGTAGGVVSGKNMDKVTFKKGSGKVMIEGNPCVTLTGLTGQNGSNANLPAGNVVQTQQQKVLVAP